MYHFKQFDVADQVSELGYPGLGYAVIRRDGAFALIATRDIAAGEFLFRVSGKRFSKPTFTSVQTGPETHIDVDPDSDLTRQMDIYPWRFTNHRCEPSVSMTHAECVALRNIRVGEEITFNYNTTERMMDEPFGCGCGAKTCAGQIGGYERALPREKARLAPLIASYLVS
jgi:SET domain